MIDKSGKWWKGTAASDLEVYLADYTEDGYVASRFTRAKCSCGGETFIVDADDTEGAASRTCVACEQTSFIADSAEYWSEAEPDRCACPCGAEEMNVCLGFAMRDDGNDVRWIYLGLRCTKCGVLGCYADWKVSYSPSLHLLEQA